MKEPVRLLWTGGWDSTFRLLMVVLVHEQAVQPYYLMDETRESLALEIRTMAEIKEVVAARWPEASKLILPTTYGARRDLEPDPEITRSYQNLYSRSRLGGQYDWLARWLAHLGLSGVELGLEDADYPHAVVNAFVKDNAELVEDAAGGPTYVLKHSVDDPDLRAVFGRFSFPLIALSKPAMEQIAQRYGFSDVLDMTWFCHHPKANGQPCGVCHPCVHTRKGGRVVPKPPLSYRLRRLVAPCLPDWIKRPIKARLGWD